MIKERTIAGMKLRSVYGGWEGEHPLGSGVRFYQIKALDRSRMRRREHIEWYWMYENATSSAFKSLTDAVEDWRSTMNLSIQAKK